MREVEHFLRHLYRRFNELLRAGEPMVFGCDKCAGPIIVPEMYVAKPRLCPSCGGEWCRP